MVFAYPGGSKSELAMITRGKGHDPVAASGRFKVFGFQRTTPELPIVADSFHTKPLLRLLQSADRFQVLALNLQEIKLFEGSREVLIQALWQPCIAHQFFSTSMVPHEPLQAPLEIGLGEKWRASLAADELGDPAAGNPFDHKD